MKRLLLAVVLLALAFALSCGYPHPEQPPADGSGGDQTCTFDQSAFDHCVIAP